MTDLGIRPPAPDLGPHLCGLADVLDGPLVTCEDPEWDTVRSAWNLAVDQRPLAVARAASAADVEATVRFAGSHGLSVAPQGTGHNAASLGDLSSTILLNTSGMRSVVIDPVEKTARVGAGVLWGEVSEAAAEYGLVTLAGSSRDVGVVGYTLGGGYSWLARKHGLAASSVLSLSVVTGAGERLEVNSMDHPDLFWSLKGGGGGVGVVVTEMEFALFSAVDLIGGMLMFPLERAREVLTAHARWTEDLPDCATTCVRLLRVPPMPELPEHIRGKSFAVVDGVVNASPEVADELLAPLRGLGPAVDTFAPMEPAALADLHMDPPGPVPACGDGMILQECTQETIEAILEIAGPDVADSPLLLVDLRHLEGAVGRPQRHGGVVDHLPGKYLLYACGITPVPPAHAAVKAEIERLVAALEPWRSERDYLNFREVAVDPERFFGHGAWAHLDRVRRTYDVHGVVRGNHPIA